MNDPQTYEKMLNVIDPNGKEITVTIKHHFTMAGKATINNKQTMRKYG
jgi:hypothetical protein